MNLSFKFETEDVYDEEANIRFDMLSLASQKSVDELKKKIKETEKFGDIVTTSDTLVRTSISRIANAIAENNDEIEVKKYKDHDGDSKTIDIQDYIRECRKAWEKLWEYFDLSEYKLKCFSSEDGILLTLEEFNFLRTYLEDVCRKSRYVEGRKRQANSFLDKRKTNLDERDKEKVQSAAKNLYLIIKRNVGISDEVRKKFFSATKDKSYVREKRFDEIDDLLEEMKVKAFDDSDDDCLNIREKEVWMEGFADELTFAIKKWIDIYEKMDELKCIAGDKYQGIIQPKCLLENAIKRNMELNK